MEILKIFRNLSMILAMLTQRTLTTKINEDNLDEETYKYFYMIRSFYSYMLLNI